MTRRPDVYRTNFPTRAIANPRALAGAIFCDINPDGGSTSPDDYPEILLCSIQIDSMDDYQRVFVSATVAGVTPYSPTPENARAGIFIRVVGTNQDIVPGVSVEVVPGHANITGAIDLPQGSYTFELYIVNNSFESGAYIQWGGSSMQVITGQVVSAQECWYESNCT